MKREEKEVAVQTELSDDEVVLKWMIMETIMMVIMVMVMMVMDAAKCHGCRGYIRVKIR